MQDLTAVHWLNPWGPLTPEERSVLERELRNELTEGHLLYGVPATAIARSYARDDVLFALDGHARAYANVHLVWQGPQRSPWPDTTLYDTFDQWAEEWMVADHAIYGDIYSDEE